MGAAKQLPPVDSVKVHNILNRAVARHSQRDGSWAGPFVARFVEKSRSGALPENVDFDVTEDLWFLIAYLVEEIHDKFDA